METLEIFRVLGVEPTEDEKIIKQAYREKLAATNPEDNPEGFKRLRTAYEEACAYAARGGEEEEPQEDDTPSGLWVKKAGEIYGNIRSRQDAERWRELFSEDIFLSLEGEEECRIKLLAFIMDHFRMPTEIWKLLDDKLSISADSAGLKEHFPADFVRYIVSKCERGEDVEFSQFEGPDDGGYDLFLQYYDKCWQAIQEENYAQAAEMLEEADGLGIFHPVMEINRANLYWKQGKEKEAADLMDRLLEQFPEDMTVAYNAAELNWGMENRDRAASIYIKLKEENESHYMANVRLTDWYYRRGDSRSAKKCAEKVLSAGADDQFMELLRQVNAGLEGDLEREVRLGGDISKTLELGWCYLQDGKYNQGIRLAESLEGRIPEEKREEHTGLLTKLYMEEAMYEDALSMAQIWEKELHEKMARGETEEEHEKDIDRLRQSHVIRMQAYHQMGFADKERFAEAIREAESLLDHSSRDIGILLEKAQIYMEMEEYEKSLETTEYILSEFQIYAAHATAMEVYRRQWDAGGVIRESEACRSYFPNYVKAYEHAAKVYLDLERREDLDRLLEEAEKNGVKSVILEAYRYQSTHKVPSTEQLDQKVKSFRKQFRDPLEDGKLQFYKEGLPILTEYLYCYPGTYMLVERGLFHQSANRLEEAREDFEKALAEDPVQPYALNGLSYNYRYQGDFEKALVYCKKAIRYMDEDMGGGIYASLAEIYSLLGDFKQAAAAYGEYVNLCGRRNHSRMTDYAVCLTDCGRVEEAVRIYEEIFAKDPEELLERKSDAYQSMAMERESAAVMEDWHGFLKKDKRPRKERLAARAGYYESLIFQELLFGTKAGVMKAVRSLAHMPDVKEDTWEGTLLVFACALYGEDKLGRKYAGWLQRAFQAEKQRQEDLYLYRRKMELFRKLLIAYYLEDVPVLEKLLEECEGCLICHNCTDPICMELRAGRWLALRKLGRSAEAEEELRDTRRRDPRDSWSQAILRFLESTGQPLPPESNNHTRSGGDCSNCIEL